MTIATLAKPSKPVKAIDYVIEETAAGQWKSYVDENGCQYREYRSDAEMLGMPLVSIVNGRCPETGRMGVAKGFIAIGQRSSGVVAIGQFAEGYLCVGQFCVGRVAAIGQFVAAPLALGQFSVGVLALAQMGLSGWGVFQSGAVLFGGWGQSVLQIGEALSGWIG